MKYYFISYSYRHPSLQTIDFYNRCIMDDPIDWLLSKHEEKGEYSLLNFWEITQKQYEKYKYEF